MDLGSFFLILALVVLVAVYISRPFLLRETEAQPLVVRKSADQLEHRRSTLLAERERLLSALQELDFDHSLDKIPAEDYPGQRAALLSAGVAVLRELDALGVLPAVEKPAPNRSPAGTNKTGYDELEAMISRHRMSHQEKSSGFCPGCGRPLQQSDQFCPRCGKKV